MTNYLRTSPTKIIFRLLLVMVVIAAIITISGNILLNKSKNTIVSALGARLPEKPFIKSLIYFPPDFIVVNTISFSEPGHFLKREGETAPPPDKQFLVIPRALIRFSLSELIIKRSLSVKSICFYNLRTDYHKFQELIKNNFQQIVDFIKLLPRQDIMLSIKRAKLELGPDQGVSGYIRADFLLKIKGDSITGSGLINEETVNSSAAGARKLFSKIKGLPLRYNFKGFLQDDGFSLENLELKRQNFYAQLWGDLTGSIFQANGFIFANTAFQEPPYQLPVFGAPKKNKFSPRRTRALSSNIDLSLVNLHILDIDCRLNLRLPDIQIEHLNFILNNNPIGIKGSIGFHDKILLNIALSFGPAKLEKHVSENLKKIDLAIEASFKDMAVNGSGTLLFDFIKKQKASPPLDKLKVDFKDLGLNFDRYPRVKMSLGELNLFCETESNKYRVALEDVGATLYLKRDRVKYIEFDSRFYDGFLKGQARMDLAGPVPKIRSTIKVKAVTANKLEDILIHFSKVYGTLDGRMFFGTYPALGLGGRMNIQNGYLHNFEFFKWLADFFGLPALKKIDFHRASSYFAVTENGASLYKINLDSQDVDLGGYFKLGINDFVSSKMSLALSRQLLGESPKFTRLLKLISPDLNQLTFNFQLSGILHRMNFKWLKSDLKKELQAHIPNFIERKIERGVAQAIEEVSRADSN